MESFRPRHKFARGSLDTCDRYLRVCVDCEMKLRMEEWASWTEEEKAKNPRYTDATEVLKTLKQRNKGKNWKATADVLQRAKEEIASEEKEPTESTTVKRRKQAVLKRAKLG